MPSHVPSLYETGAEQYAETTFKLDMSAVRARFLGRIRPGGSILEAGTGSGRDALAFHQAGYQVDAFDGSEALAGLATLLTGLDVTCMTFEQLDAFNRYDGVWACASLVHLDDRGVSSALDKLLCAVRPGGVLFTCFKKGPGYRIAPDGRPFNDFEVDRLMALPALEGRPLLEHWETVHVAQPDTVWTNVIVRKH